VARAWVAVWVAGLMVACQPAADSRHEDGPRQVLMLGTKRHAVMSQAVEAVQQRNGQLGDREAALGIDFRDVESEADIDPVLDKALAEPDRYRAIFTNSQAIARAAQLRAPGRPIVFDGVDDPVANCLVDSLARPGRNATGYMHLLPDGEAKMLEVLHDGFPDVRRVIVLVSGDEYVSPACDADGRSLAAQAEPPPCTAGLRKVDAYVAHLLDARRIEAVAAPLGMAVDYLVLCSPQDFGLVRTAARAGPAAGLIVPWHFMFVGNANALIAALATTRRPAVYPNKGFTDAGGLLSVEPILERGRDRASVLTLMQVLAGRPPASLPVQSPRGFEIRLNAKAAVELGLSPGRLLMHRADQILF